MASSDIHTQLHQLEQKQGVLEKELSVHRASIQGLREQLIAEDMKSASPLTPLPSTATPPPLTPQREAVQAETESPNPQNNPLGTDVKRESKTTAASEPVSKPKKNLQMTELDFGKVWFVRLGIISLITGLVFLSNFAYQNYIYNWGAAPRLAGLYFLSVILLGVGTYFEKAKAALSNYGRVLAAGAIATLYYASYAAHHIERLQVITTPLLGGIVLFLSAGACLAYALWKKSTTTALCSIVLAFYSTSINPVGGFTLVSGLILTLTGVVLLDRLRQASIGFTTMLGAYLSFAYWQLLVNRGTDFTHASWFVLGYWVLCTAVIFKQRSQSKPFFSETQLLGFTSVNNSLFLLLTSINFATMQIYTSVWLNIATIGTAFIGLSLLAQHRKALPRALAHLYLGKGFALITLALCIKLSGSSLALSLTIQAGMAIVIGSLSQRKLVLYAGYLALLLGFIIYGAHFQEVSTVRHVLLFSLYFGIAEFVHLNDRPKLDNSIVMLRDSAVMVSVFAMIALIGIFLSLAITSFAMIILFFGVFTVLRLIRFTVLDRFLPEPFYHLSHLLSFVGGGLLFAKLISGIALSEAGLLTCILYITATVQIVTQLKFTKDPPNCHLRALYIGLATVMVFATLILNDSINTIIIITSLLPIAYHLVYQHTRVKSILVYGFVSYLLAWLVSVLGYMMSSYVMNQPSAAIQLICALIPLGHRFMMKFEILDALQLSSNKHSGSVISAALTVASSALIVIWQIHYLHYWELSLSVTALALYLLEDHQSEKSNTVCAIVVYLIALGSVLIMPQHGYLVRYTVLSFALLTYFINTQSLKKMEQADMSRAIAIGFSLALWYMTSQQTISLVGSSALSICWALVGLAILSLGFSAKDFAFRTIAFVILGATVLHVYGVDVWRLGALLRIISFITLGLVLLIVGYLYCRKVDTQAQQAPDNAPD